MLKVTMNMETRKQITELKYKEKEVTIKSIIPTKQ